MDTDLLVAELLLRGFEHHKDDEKGRRMYMKDEVIVSIRGHRAMIASRYASLDKILEAVEYAEKTANGDRRDTSDTQ